jgi:putative redox protein
LDKNEFMKIILTRKNDKVLFESSNSQGHSIFMEGSPEWGGEEIAMRPMEVLLSALAGCSSIDIVSLLKKMRQDLDDLTLEVNGERAENSVPAVFEKIHLHFILKGNLDESKVIKAIQMSVEKYCSVAKMIENTAKISWSYQIISHEI